MRVNDLSIGLASICLSIALFYYSSTLPPIPGQIYGADAFPQLIAIGFMICGVTCLFLHFRSRSEPGLPFRIAFGSAFKVCGLGLGILAYTLFANTLGYLLSTFLLLAATMIAQRTKWWAALLAAVVITIGTYVIFFYLLRVPLPEFRLES